MRSRSATRNIVSLIVPPLSIILSIIGLETNNPNLIIFSIVIAILVFYLYLRGNQYKILSNTIMLFPLFGGIYLLSYPILKFVLNLLPTSLMGITDEYIIHGTFFGGSLIIVYIWICILIPKQSFKIANEVELYRTITLRPNNFIIDILFLLMLVYMISRYVRIGGYSAVFTGLVSRQMMSQELEVIPFYSYIKYSYISYTVYSIYSVFNSEKGSTKKYARTFRAIIVSLFWVIDLSLGNRRGLLYVLLAVILYFSNNKNKKIKPIFYILIGAIVIAFMMIGVYRNAFNTNAEIRIRDAFGETIYPMVTLYYYIGNHVRPFYCGTTLLYIFTYIIPHSVWPSKPISLANQFKIDYFNTSMGYAFTPFTEMYVNFSYAGIVIGAIIYIIILNWVAKNKSKFPLLYLATYIEIINFFRGEVATSCFEILIMYLTLKILYLVNGNRKEEGYING